VFSTVFFPEKRYNKGMKQELKKFYVWVAIVVFLVLIVVIVVWPRRAGQVVAGFPQGLLIDSTAKVSASYAINYSSSTNQYTAEWDSSAPPISVASMYSGYFSSHGWKIVNEERSSLDLQGIYAVSSTNAVNMTAAAEGSGSHVTVSYLGGGK
jgi:hypothetical protein